FPIRSKVLRNNSIYKYCEFEGDERLDSIHIGAYKKNTIIGGVSLIKNKSTKMKLENCYQLRGMCVLDYYQNIGIGQKLLENSEKICKKLNVNYIWMNAREKAVDFYIKFNYLDLGESYIIEGVGKHSFLYKKLK
ncbi:MAG: hypothetical protein ABR90_03055, partial [Cryomorphaceae bacterium BACL29 MAG-121220-bin8]